MIDLKIGILGGGVLGKAIKNYYPNAKVFDKYNKQDSLEEVQKQDYFFICVPTPYKEGSGIDLKEVADAISRVAQPGKIIIIKSLIKWIFELSILKADFCHFKYKMTFIF